MIIKRQDVTENYQLFQLKINNEMIFVKKYPHPLPRLKYSIHESYTNDEIDDKGNLIYYPESHILNSTHYSSDAEIIDNLYDDVNDLTAYEIIENLIK
jgi:hypothetical protein